MTAQILSIIGSLLLCVIGIWKYAGRKAEERRKLADEARKDLDNAKKNDSPSDFLDGFNKL